MKRKLTTISTIGAFIAILLLAPSVYAAGAPAAPTRKLDIKLGAPFCDNAILQREMEVPVWGWSKPGTKVTVEFVPQPGSGQAGQKVTATAGKDGKWLAKLAKMKASFEPAEMIIKEKDGPSTSLRTGKTVKLKNILVGEVWMASGQSNMQWTCTKSTCNKLSAEFKKDCEAKGLKINPIREFRVNSVTSQLHPIEKATGAWRDGDYLNYSAIAFAFAEKLFRELNVPIGILNCSFSQTPIEAWVPREGWASAKDEYSKAINLKCLKTDPTTPEHKQAWSAFYKSLENQLAASEAMIKEGKTPKPISAKVPGNVTDNRSANWLFNGKLNPVVPYAIRGAIWNQGYANMGKGISYYNNLHSLIRGWRIVWDRPELPVYFHQFYTPSKTVPPPSISGTAEMRLGTTLARDIPNAGMASQIDISGGIHYYNKAVPGQRLALHALKNQYPSTTLRAGGKAKDIVAEGPIFKSYQVKDGKVIVEFDNAEGGLVVANTAFNRNRNQQGATGYADPKVIENGEDKVKLFWLAGKDRIWHPATFKIEGEKVVVSSDAVEEPRGISYASGGVAFNPCLYNKAMLPMTPFIYYDNKMVTSNTWPGIDSLDWPDEKLKIAGETIDPKTIGKIYEYRKMPLLSVQFRDNAVFQAGKPVTIWGTTRKYGDWQDLPEEGDCKVHFEFGPSTELRTGPSDSSPRLDSGQAGQVTIKKIIDVTPEMVEWKVTLPPMEAGSKPYTLKVHFTIDGEKVHERVIPGIVFGDVWCVVAPALDKKSKWTLPEVAPSGQIVRMIENQSNRDGRAEPSRFSICTSRTPKNRLAAHWKDADGLAAAIGNTISAKTGRPVGIIFLEAKKDVPIKNWIAPGFLKDTPSLMEDYKTVGSQYPDNPYYLANVRRYVSDWKHYWGEYIPEMMVTKAVPDGSSWGWFPSPRPNIGDSTACFEYNVYMYCFTPASLSGIVFISGKAMVADGGANFAPEMTVLANSFKTRFGLEPGPDGAWTNGNTDIPFIYTLPDKALAPEISVPKIKGASTAVEISNWANATKVVDALDRMEK